MNADKDFALDWLKKAGNDLKAAQLILAAKDGPLDTACFHAQQSSGKIAQRNAYTPLQTLPKGTCPATSP